MSEPLVTALLALGWVVAVALFIGGAVVSVLLLRPSVVKEFADALREAEETDP